MGAGGRGGMLSSHNNSLARKWNREWEEMFLKKEEKREKLSLYPTNLLKTGMRRRRKIGKRRRSYKTSIE